MEADKAAGPLGSASSEVLGAWVPTGERLPSHNATVLVWRAGVFDRLTPGRVQITKFRLTGDGPEWDVDRHTCRAVPRRCVWLG
jgi:hypothetical protein